MPADPSSPQAAAALLRRAAIVREETPAGTLDLLWRDDAPDDQLRAAVRARLEVAVAPIERELRLGAARRLAEMQADAAAEQLLGDATPVLDSLDTMDAGARARLLAEFLDQSRLDLLAAALPIAAPAVDRPSLLVRLADCPEPEVAACATDLLAASGGGPLSPGARSTLVWWSAATLRARLGDERRADHALVETAAELLLDAPSEGAAEIAARLAAAIAARPEELPGLLVECLGDRRPELFAAVLGQASGLDSAAVRAMLIEPDGDRLLLLLRAQDVDRASIARIGVALADADGRRDLDRFADALDAAMAVAPEDAAALFDPLHLPADYRAARAAWARAR